MSRRSLEILDVDSEDVGESELLPAVRALRAGGLVAFPTETVYGLGADATNPTAVERIFEAKQRPSGHPLIVHVECVARARRVVAGWPDEAAELAAEFWPGPLTLILRRAKSISEVVTGGLQTVGVRIPDHAVAEALVSAADCPVAAPSANPHKAISPTRGVHVERGLGDRIDCLVDGGPTPLGLESTVLDLTESAPVVLRPGMVPRRELADVLGRQVRVRNGSDVSGSGEPRPSPGLGEEHYAPSGELLLAERETLERRDWGGERIGAVVRDPLERASDTDRVLELGGDPVGFARELYDALHRLDESGCRRILVERPPDDEEWRPVWNRLRRAASGVVES